MAEMMFSSKTITKADQRFPSFLAGHGFDKLKYWGDWEEDKFNQTVAVVGSRKMSRYGQEAVERIVGPLSRQGYTIISGFMYGVDQEAHKVCCQNGGRTMAVLGYGLGYYQLKNFKPMVEEILDNRGLMVSPFEDDFKSTLWTFPRRNIVVAGMATLGIVVIEADLDSGSLVTAQIGRKMGKTIWAIPGPITSAISRGTNNLIKTGEAKMCCKAEDLMESLAPSQMELLTNQKESDPIMGVLKIEPLEADEIGLKIKQPVTEVLARLTMLMLEGKVVETEGKFRLSVTPG